MTALYLYDTQTAKRLGTVVVDSSGGITGAPPAARVMATQIADVADGQEAKVEALNGWTNGYLLISTDPAPGMREVSSG